MPDDYSYHSVTEFTNSFFLRNSTWIRATSSTQIGNHRDVKHYDSFFYEFSIGVQVIGRATQSPLLNKKETVEWRVWNYEQGHVPFK